LENRSYTALIFFLCLFFPLGSVSFAALVDIGLDQNSTGGYGAGTLSYDCCGPSFMGSLTVSGLKEGMVYQMKLEGQPADDSGANANLGSVGRWWVVDPSLPLGGRNTDDAGRLTAEASGYTVLGYLLFDSFTATGGEQTIDFYANWSYHTAGVDQRGSIVLPDGSYQVTFLLTENETPWISPLLKKNISFDVPCPVPIPSTVLLFGSGLGLVVFGRKKIKQ
jgi:hypothetical protein